jgi:hypothetical protein
MHSFQLAAVWDLHQEVVVVSDYLLLLLLPWQQCVQHECQLIAACTCPPFPPSWWT